MTILRNERRSEKASMTGTYSSSNDASGNACGGLWLKSWLDHPSR